MSIQPYLDTYLTRHGVSLDTSSDRELMYALTAAVRDLQKPMGHAQGKRKLYFFNHWAGYTMRDKRPFRLYCRRTSILREVSSDPSVSVRFLRRA